MICHVANGFCVPLPTWPICRRCLQFRQSTWRMKMAPETPGHWSTCLARLAPPCADFLQEACGVSGSKPKIGEVAVANGDAAARRQKAVDRGHQAAEQGAGGNEADRCSLGHGRPLSEVAEALRFVE